MCKYKQINSCRTHKITVFRKGRVFRMGNNSGHTGSEIKAKAVAWGQSTLNLRNPVGLRLGHNVGYQIQAQIVKAQNQNPFRALKSLQTKVRLGLTAWATSWDGPIERSANKCRAARRSFSGLRCSPESARTSQNQCLVRLRPHLYQKVINSSSLNVIWLINVWK
jgi:hypothetical protein